MSAEAPADVLVIGAGAAWFFMQSATKDPVKRLKKIESFATEHPTSYTDLAEQLRWDVPWQTIRFS